MTIPEGAIISEDGQFWWDEDQQIWHPIESGDAGGGGTGDGGGGGGSGGGGGGGGQAAFDFDTSGLRIDAENSPVPSAGEALKAAFAVCNTGTAAGSAHVTFTIDGSDAGVTWDSPQLQPGECAAPDGDGYVHGLPQQGEGSHTFEATADPAGSNGGKAQNTIDIGAPEN